MSLGRQPALLCLDCEEIHADRFGRCPSCGSKVCQDVRVMLGRQESEAAEGPWPARPDYAIAVPRAREGNR